MLFLGRPWTMDNKNTSLSLRIPDIQRLAAEETERRKIESKEKRKEKKRIHERKKRIMNKLNTPNANAEEAVDDASNVAVLAERVVGRNSANRQENLNLLASVRRENTARLAARYASDEEKLAADIDRVEKKDEEEKEALFLILQENIGGGIRVATPGPTPAPSRSSSRSASPTVTGSRRLTFIETPAKRAKSSAVLSPVPSVGSSGDEAELEGTTIVESTKIPAATPSSTKKLCLFVASGMGRALTEPTKIEMMLGDLPLDIKAVAQVEDCTCLLQADGKIFPAVHYVTGRLWGGSLQAAEGPPLDLGEPIEGIQSSGPFLLATGASGRFYMLEYLPQTGTFKKPATLDLATAADNGAVAIGPNSLHWFGKELGDLGLCGVLRTLPLDGIGTAALPKDTGAMELPKLRVKAKIAAGSEQVLVLAYDKNNDGKLYAMHNGKLEKVRETGLSSSSRKSTGYCICLCV